MKFQIGEWVCGNMEAVPHYMNTDSSRPGQISRIVQSQERRPFHGQIVGAARRHNGEYCGWGDPEDPACLVSSGTVIVWLVREGLFNKPIEAFEHDLQPVLGSTRGVPEVHYLPVTYHRERIETMRAEMRYWPRDARGRWVKKA